MIVCTHTLERWENLRAAVASVREQTLAAAETIVVVDGDEELERRVRDELDGVEVLPNRHAPGLSGGRQTGAEHARGTILAFLDDDAAAAPDWLARLAANYDDPRVLGVGGAIEPDWEQPRPSWFPPEFNWVVGCTYPGMPDAPARVRNVIGANMSIRADVLAAVGAFDPRLGRAAGMRSVSGAAEETELCIRAGEVFPGRYWIFDPRARVTHAVPPQRGSWRYFARRCAVEGSAKGLLARICGSEQGLSSERTYVRSILPRALAREVSLALRGRPAGAARAGAIVAGLTITTAAYLWSSRGWHAGPAHRSFQPAAPENVQVGAAPAPPERLAR